MINYTITEVANKLSVPRYTVSNWVRGGKFTGIIIEGNEKKKAYFIPERSLNLFIQEHPELISYYQNGLPKGF